MSALLRIDVNRLGGAVVVRPYGRLDSGRIGQLEGLLKAEIAHGRRHLVLDMGETLFISSSALRVFVVVHRQLVEDGAFRVVNLVPHIAEMIRTAGFDKVIDVGGDVESALAAMPAAVPAAERDEAEVEAEPVVEAVRGRVALVDVAVGALVGAVAGFAWGWSVGLASFVAGVVVYGQWRVRPWR